MNRGSKSWYLSAKICFGRVRWACREQERSSIGGVASLMLSCSVGWRPVGSLKDEVKVCEVGWCREGKEKSVGDGLVSSPITARKPPRLSSSASRAFSMERMPTSSREDPGVRFVREMFCGCGDEKVVSVRVWDMVS